jgi:steroid delta-isomerase-like uncharacterized protein
LTLESGTKLSASGSKKEEINMSAEENKAIIRNMIEEENKGNMLWEIWESDVVIHNDNPPPPTMGKQEFQHIMEEFLRAFPDFHEEIEALIAEDDKVVGKYTETATMKGNFMGMEATGKQYTIPAIEIYRLANGKIVEVWLVRPYTSMFQQLGLMP